MALENFTMVKKTDYGLINPGNESSENLQGYFSFFTYGKIAFVNL